MIKKTTEDNVIIDRTVPKAQFYKNLYELANARGLKASVDAEPTAVELSNGSIMRDGPCGFAWVVLPDGRKGFARWITKNGLGDKAGRGGVRISASLDRSKLKPRSFQSLDRCRAYATAFSEVLKANGIDSYTISEIN